MDLNAQVIFNEHLGEDFGHLVSWPLACLLAYLVALYFLVEM